MPSINNFRSVLLGVARPTLFQVIITGAPVVNLNAEMFRLTCKSASLPEDEIGEIAEPFWGRKIYYPGDRSYSTWSTTLIGDNSWENYRRIADWHSKINHPSENVAVTTNALNYKADGRVYVYDQTDQRRLEMTLVGLWPTKLDSIDLNWDSTDQGIDLKVTWRFDYIQPVIS